MKTEEKKMKVKILSVTGCPHHAAAVARVKDALASAGVAAEIEERWITDAAEAEALKFGGSPTVRIDGEDVEPAVRGPSLSCRVYPGGDSAPPLASLARAIQAAQQRRGLR